MKRFQTHIYSVSIIISLFIFTPAFGEQLTEIAASSGIKGGFLVFAGTINSPNLQALHQKSNFLIHALDTDPQRVDSARKHIRSAGLYGKISVGILTDSRLPYIDNLINLLFCDENVDFDQKEVLRVLAPQGIAYIKKAGIWSKTIKPRPDHIDEWTHFLHSASGNAVANDSVVGPPRRMQWQSSPDWDRNHHKLASISSVVSAGGKLFYIFDEATSGSMLVPGRWSIVARDAFNGVELWRRKMSSWVWENQKFRSGPVQVTRLLLAGNNSVFAPLGLGAAVSRMDAATGEIEATYPETEGAEEILLTGNMLVVVKGDPIAEHAATHPDMKKNGAFTNSKSIVAIDIQNGEAVWTWKEKGSDFVMPLSIAIGDEQVFFQAGSEMMCVSLKSGNVIWKTNHKSIKRKNAKAGENVVLKWNRAAGWSVSTVVAHDKFVYWADGKELKALSVKDGREIWSCPCKAGFKSPVDVFVADGLIWVGPDYNAGRDLLTGQIKRNLVAFTDLRTAGHHHRCYREKATENYIIGGYRGMEFFDLDGDDHSRNNWIRGNCQYGILPCNGLLYAPSHACGCYMETKLLGFWAVAPEALEPVSQPVERLTKGAAYGKISSNAKPDSSYAWPMYRHDALRSGSTKASIPSNLNRKWQQRFGAKITPPVVADGIVLTSIVGEHRVAALSANSGDTVWTFTAGGPVDSSPTIFDGTVLFGSADGYVYCVRLGDGELVWRFQAAVQDRRTVCKDQVESVWPVHGSVLVLDEIAYVTAGRSSYLDCGLVMYALDPATGKVLNQSRICSEHPEAVEGNDGPKKMTKKLTQNATDPKTFQSPDLSDGFSMAGGTTSDILVSDGDSVYLRTLRFDRQCVLQQAQANHLFSTTNLLDDGENHRSHWMIGTGDFSRIPVAYSWIANRAGAYKSNVSVPYGVMLSFDDNNVWGIRRINGYTLYRDSVGPALGKEEDSPDIRYTPEKIASRWKWSNSIDIRPRAMVKTADKLLIGGMKNIPQKEPQPEDFARFEGRADGKVLIVSAGDGTIIETLDLDTPPIFDGMAVANGKLYIATVDGRIIAMGK